MAANKDKTVEQQIKDILNSRYSNPFIGVLNFNLLAGATNTLPLVLNGNSVVLGISGSLLGFPAGGGVDSQMNLCRINMQFPSGNVVTSAAVLGSALFSLDSNIIYKFTKPIFIRSSDRINVQITNASPDTLQIDIAFHCVSSLLSANG